MEEHIVYKRANLQDLRILRFAEGLAKSSEEIEYNVFGLGHELWIAATPVQIVGLAVISRFGGREISIINLKVTPAHQGRNIGSKLLEAIFESYPENEFSVVPVEGTENFYRNLGFVKEGNWVMRRPGNRSITTS